MLDFQNWCSFSIVFDPSRIKHLPINQGDYYGDCFPMQRFVLAHDVVKFGLIVLVRYRHKLFYHDSHPFAVLSVTIHSDAHLCDGSGVMNTLP